MDAFAVYLCGDELPTALFPFHDEESKAWARGHAEKYPHDKPRWADKEIREVALGVDLSR